MKVFINAIAFHGEKVLVFADNEEEAADLLQKEFQIKVHPKDMHLIDSKERIHHLG